MYAHTDAVRFEAILTQLASGQEFGDYKWSTLAAFSVAVSEQIGMTVAVGASYGRVGQIHSHSLLALSLVPLFSFECLVPVGKPDSVRRVKVAAPRPTSNNAPQQFGKGDSSTTRAAGITAI
jgi:hypothetical protein